MRVEVYAPDPDVRPLRVRAILLNDSFEAVRISVNDFVGPNVVGDVARAGLPMESVEPTTGTQDVQLVLQPFAFYGRERQFDDLEHGVIKGSAYYRPAGGGRELRADTVIDLDGD